VSKRYEQAKTYTEKYKSQLKPCKWCGNTDIRITTDRLTVVTNDDRTISNARHKIVNGWSVVCSTPHCDCTGIYTSVRKAIERWNEMQSKP
jgi:hypothetical protein